MTKSWTLALVALLAVSTVADAKSPFSKGEADFGRAISQSQCEKIARKNVEPYLNNPSGVRYKFGQCTAQTMRGIVYQKVPRQSGYGMEFQVNAKNKWGNYTGYTKYVIMIHDGKVIRRMRANNRGNMTAY